MKVTTILAAVILAGLIVAGAAKVDWDASAQGATPPETLVLAKESKLGKVTFNHLQHITGNRSMDLKSGVRCVDCHHTAQPAAEAAKNPPHKTAWPADRTTTLTMELLIKDANALGAKCTDCHARTGTKPKILPEIPTATLPGAAEPTIMTNQQAFHHTCGACHDAVAKIKPDSTGPTSKKCTACHKKTAA